MYCNCCGAFLDENSRFCSVCGQKVAQAPAAEAPSFDAGVAQPVADSTFFAPGPEMSGVEGGGTAAPDSGLSGGDVGAAFAPGEEVTGGFAAAPEMDAPETGFQGQISFPGFEPQPAYLSQPEYSSAPEGEAPMPTAPAGKSNKLKIGLLLGGICAMLAVTVLLVCLMAMSGGPAQEIAMAAKNTLDEGSFTLELSGDVVVDSGDTKIQVELDLDDRELILYSQTYDSWEDGFTAVYDGYVIMGSDSYSFAYSIADELDEFFDSCEEWDDGEIDWEEVLDSFEAGLYDDLQEHMDMEVLEHCLEDYMDNLNDEDWLEEYAGFSEEEKRGVTCYSFEPDLYDFTKESMTHLEPAFRDPQDYEELMDELADSKRDLREAKPEIAVGIDGDVLSFLEITGDFDGDEIDLKLEFSKVGETEIDRELLEELLDEATIID